MAGKKPASYTKRGSKGELRRSSVSAKMVWVKAAEIQAKLEPLVVQKCEHGKKPKKCKDCAPKEEKT